MNHYRLTFLFILFFVAAAAHGELTADQIRQAKRALGLVEIPAQRAFTSAGVRCMTTRKSYNAAFCVDRAGVFVTNAYVSDIAAGDELNLILGSGEKDERTVKARVIRSDQAADAAILLAPEADCPALPLDTSGNVFETQSVVAFGGDLGDRPQASVKLGRIGSLQKRKGELNTIVVHALLNHGNAGGPVLLADGGSVIGMVRYGVVWDGSIAVVPAHRLHQVLQKPMVTLSPLEIVEAKLHEEAEMAVRVLSVVRPRPDYTLTVALDEVPTRQEFTGKAGADGVYRFRWIPVPRSKANRIKVAARFSKGTVSGTCGDRAVTIDGKKVMLSEVEKVSGGKTAEAVLRDGKHGEVRVEDLRSIKVAVGDDEVVVDFDKAIELRVEKPQPATRRIPFAVTVRLNESVVDTLQGFVEVSAPSPGPQKTGPRNENVR